MTLLDFNELGVGQQVGIQTTDRGVMSGTAVASSAGTGATIGFINATAANHSFNGDGSGGAIQLASITTIRQLNIQAPIVWNFLPAGVAAGSLVHFVIEGINAGSLTLQNNGVDIFIGDMADPVPTAFTVIVPFPALVFTGSAWELVHFNIHPT